MRGKTRLPGEKPLQTEQKTNKLSLHMTEGQEIDPEPFWRKASAVTTAPTVFGIST